MFKNFLYLYRINPGAVKKAVLLEIGHSLLIAVPTAMLLLILTELFKEHPDQSKLWTFLWIMTGLILLQFQVASKAMLTSNSMVYDIANKLRIRLGNHLQKLSLGYYRRRDPGDLASVILQDVANFEMIFAHSIGNIAAALFGTVLITSFLLAIDWRLALILLAALVVVLPLMAAANALMDRLGKRQIAARNATGSGFLEYIQGIRYMKAFGMTGKRFMRLDAALKNQRDESIRLEAKGGPLILLAALVFDLFYLGMLGIGLYFYAGTSLSIPAYLAFIVIGHRLYEPIKVVLVDYIIMRYMNTSINRVIQVLDAPSLPVDHPSVPESFSIGFENVTFGYLEGKPVLHHLSWSADEHTLTALVGASGSGKTTVTALIARFWDVQEGSVKIGGVDIRNIPAEYLYHCISEVFQDVYLFDDSIYNNILIGKPDASEEEIVRIAEKAQVMEFAATLPEGLFTKVGEGGNKLSGGQKQRISIARALLKEAPIVLLDEATASLDPENEVYIQQAIQELVRDKTVIVIAHKLATVIHADQILVLEDGMMLERGTHHQLLAANGSYARLWHIQQKSSGWKLADKKKAIPD